MINVIRTTQSRVKYCGGTVDSLIESNGKDEHQVIIQCSAKTPNENGIEALKQGIAASNGKPFVFLEDDVRFIKHFNQAAETFSRACSGVKTPFIPLCAAYPEGLNKCRGIAWRYPVKNFYGTQAFVIKPADAEAFLKFLKTKGELPSRGFDMLLKQWAESLKVEHLLTPQRCFVQHIGVESSLHNGRFHHYSAWPGADWEFRTGAFSLDEQKNRPCDRPLAKAIASWFGTAALAYDVGCSTGNYVRELRGQGIRAHGFDATPGIEGPHITELDVTRSAVLAVEAKGNVMCLEVAEHIDPKDEANFLSNLHDLCSGKLVISWAIPGQGGKRHVNEQAAAHVIARMHEQQFTINNGITEKLREAATISWFKDSLYAFERVQKMN